MYVTLDGFIAGPNGELDWIFKVSDEELDKYSDDLLNTVDVILLGRVLSKDFLDYWPTDTSEFARKINDLPKIVFSKTLDKVESKSSNVSLIKDNVVEEIEKMKRQPGKNIVLYGGAETVSSFTQLGLIDEYQLLVVPIVLGKGIPLFKNIGERINLKLLKTRTFKSGVVGLYYRKETEE